MNKIEQILTLLSLFIAMTSGVWAQHINKQRPNKSMNSIVLKSEDLDKYLGIYSSTQLQLMKIFRIYTTFM